ILPEQEATPMDAIQFLKKEHQRAKAAMAKLVKAPPGERGALWEELEPELTLHEELEDECLYTPLSDEAATAKDPKLASWRQRHRSGRAGGSATRTRWTRSRSPSARSPSSSRSTRAG